MPHHCFRKETRKKDKKNVWCSKWGRMKRHTPRDALERMNKENHRLHDAVERRPQTIWIIWAKIARNSWARPSYRNTISISLIIYSWRSRQLPIGVRNAIRAETMVSSNSVEVVFSSLWQCYGLPGWKTPVQYITSTALLLLQKLEWGEVSLRVSANGEERAPLLVRVFR